MKKLQILWETFRGLGVLTPFILFTVVGPAVGALILISTSQDWLPILTEINRIEQLTYFITISTILVGLSVAPTHACSLVAGMIFGVTLGPVVALVTIFISALFSLILARMILNEKSYHKLLERPLVAKVRNELLGKDNFKSMGFISLIRLSPAMPFAATNVILASVRVSTLQFSVGSIIGLAPRIIIVAVAGAGLSELDLSQGSNRWLLFLGVISTLVLIIYVSKIIRRVTQVS